jgi:hypothetical protein
MARALKRIVYGGIYLAVFCAIAAGIFFRYLKPAASCFDRVQNQGEQGIDCGGPCANACTGNLRAIQTLAAYFFPNGQGRGTLLAQALNPNGDFGTGALAYVFHIFDAKTGTNSQSVPGSAFFYPNQTRYIVVPNYPVIGSATSSMRVDLVVATSGLSWTASSTMGPAPVFTFSNVITTSADQGTVSVSGMLGSGETSSLKSVEVDVIFENQNHAPVGASRTLIDSVPANGSAPFSVSYPSSADIVPGNTIVAAYALRT